MSSNLLKGVFTSVSNEDTRVIDTNELVRKRIEELSEKMQQTANKGFVSGLNAPKVEIPAELFEDNEDESVIKADELSNEAMEEILQASKEEATTIISDAKLEAERIISDAKLEAEKLLSNARKESEQEGVLIKNNAREEGYADGMEAANAELLKVQSDFAAKEQALEDEYQKLVDELEPMFVETITGIYEHIFHIELRSYKEILLYLISTTMRKVEGDRNFIVHVSKEDYPYVSMQKKQIMAGATAANNSVDIIEDLTLSKNECFIETDGGIFDCGLGTQLTELSQRLAVLAYEK